MDTETTLHRFHLILQPSARASQRVGRAQSRAKPVASVIPEKWVKDQRNEVKDETNI